MHEICYLNEKNNMSCDFFVFLVHEDILLNMNFNKFDFVFWMCCGSIAHKRILGNSRPVRQIQRTCDMSGLLKPTARIRGLSTNIYIQE